MVKIMLKHSSITSLKSKQQGVVLIVSLVFLVALTAVAAALMQNTTTDIKMAGASQEKSIAIQETISEMDRVIFNEINRVNDTADVDGNGDGKFLNRFSLSAERFRVSVDNPNGAISLPVTSKEGTITIGSLDIANQYKLEADCPREVLGTSTDVFTCNILRTRVNRTYGRNNNSDVDVNAGIAQQLF